MTQEQLTDEDRDAPAPLRPPDSIGIAVGSAFCVTNHRFGDLYIDTPAGRSPRLSVSRYYWELAPPVAVDFVRDLRFGEQELGVKKRYFREHNIRYILIKDMFDGEGAEAALAALEDDAVQTAPQTPQGSKPLTGPRRRR